MPQIRNSIHRTTSTWIILVATATMLTGCNLFSSKKENSPGSTSTASVTCGGEGQSPCAPTPTPSWMTGKMASFTSEEQWRLYMQTTLSKMTSSRSYSNAAPAADMAADSMSADSPASNETITNNQEAGVDEGGIVKNIGEHLVILRKGVLTLVSISQPGNPIKTASMPVASTPDLEKDVWYDELLVRGNVIIVTGFRFNLSQTDSAVPHTGGAVEINTFILESGELRRVQQLWLEANDYFSGSNFATRLIKDDLTLYMPFNAVTWTDQGLQPSIPRHFTRESGGFRAGSNLVDWANIWFPPEFPASPTLHVVTKCRVSADAKLDCLSKALIGSGAEQYYVSANNIWLWSYPWLFKFDIAQMIPEVHSVKGWGNPIDQFSFRESDDSIHVLTFDERTERGSIYDVDNSLPDEATSISEESPRSESPVIHDSVVNLLSIPLAAFDEVGNQTLGGIQVLKVAQEKGWLQVLRQRWVGEKIVVALATQLHTLPSDAVKIRTALHVVSSVNKNSKWIEWREEISRIERLDVEHVAVFGAAQNVTNTEFNASIVTIAEDPKTLASVALANMNEGESRSHGFFWKPSENGGGRFGLAVINDGETGWFGNGVSNVAWFGVSKDWSLTKQGITSSAGKREDTCASSCVDWYGNTRPIFLGTRIFALMGHELVEVQFQENTASERGTRLLF
jgi:hypothetical protein